MLRGLGRVRLPGSNSENGSLKELSRKITELYYRPGLPAILLVAGAICILIAVVVAFTTDGITQSLLPSLLTAGAIAISVGAVVVAFHIQREIAKKRAIFDVIHKNLWDEDSIKASRYFNKIARPADRSVNIKQMEKSDKPLTQWAAPEHRDRPEAQNIKLVLNDYELIAIGIRHEILDEEIYISWFRGGLLRDWHLSSGFIDDLRNNDNAPRLFCEFEALAIAWESGEYYAGRPNPKGDYHHLEPHRQ